MSPRKTKPAPREGGWWDESDRGWGGDHDDQAPPTIPLTTTVTVNGRKVDDDPLVPPPGEPSGAADTARDSIVRGWFELLDPE